jgi:hypothetical protein
VCAQTAATLLEAHAKAFESGTVLNPFYDALDLDRYRLPATIFDPRTPEDLWKALQEYAGGQTRLSWLDVFDAAMERREQTQASPS